MTDGRRLSLREIATEIALPFHDGIREVSDAATCRHVFAVLEGRARSLLDFADRPIDYEDVGRAITWARRAHRTVSRSRYEQVIQRVIAHRAIRVGNATWRPERMLDWFHITFREVKTGRRRVFDLEDLAAHAL